MHAPLATDDERTAFLDAVEESLRPLMKVVFAYGVSYQELMDVVRALYIYALRDRFASEGLPPTPTRLGLMTGVTKGEIEKLFGSRELREQQRLIANQRLDQICLLLAKWHDDPQFSTPYGAPLDLSLEPEAGFRTFDDLVTASGTELDRETAIEALVANSCAEVHKAKFVRCTSRTFLPLGKDLSRISRLGRLGGALHSNYVHNLLRDEGEPSFFERTLESDFPLSDRGQSIFMMEVRQEGEAYLADLDRWLSSKQSDYIDSAGRRYGVTTFFFEQLDKLEGSPVASKQGNS